MTHSHLAPNPTVWDQAVKTGRNKNMAVMFNQRHYVAVADTIGLTLRQIDQAETTARKIYGDHRPDEVGSVAVYSSAIAIHRLIDNLEVTFAEDNANFKADVFNTRIGLIRREGLQA
jgi:hypothetical protein